MGPDLEAKLTSVFRGDMKESTCFRRYARDVPIMTLGEDDKSFHVRFEAMD